MLGIGECTYRDLTLDDLPAARLHLERLDMDDRFNHFFRIMEDADFEAWAERAASHALIGCIAAERVVGLAELALDGDQAELVLSVDAERRKRGIGTGLFERACIRARDEGARYLAVLVTRGDRGLIDLAARHDGFTAFKRGESLLLPGVPSETLRWLLFDLDRVRPEGWLGEAVRSVRSRLGLAPAEKAQEFATQD